MVMAKFLTINLAYTEPGHENKNILPFQMDANPKSKPNN
jgi:hypothetical protein